MKKTALILLAVLLCVPVDAQILGQRRKKKEADNDLKELRRLQGNATDRRPRGFPMYYEVIDGDTVYVDSIDPVWCFPKGRKAAGKDWRKQYRLVYNFNKVYPYALVGRKMMKQVDSTIAADVTKRSQRNTYTHDVMLELFRLFEKDIRNMTVSQGMVLMRLVDRECGMPPYDIIKTYRNNFTAGFWQLVAKVFGADLKKRYDPEGGDKDIEELVRIWESGAWNSFYFSIFFDYPKKTVIETDVLSSTVEKRRSRNQ
mgnify:FL=1